MTNEHNVGRSRSGGSHWPRRLVWGALGLGLVGGFAYIVWPKPIDVEVATASRRTLTVTLDEEGYARIRDRFVVSAPLAGSLLRIGLHVGDTVRAGDVLAQLLPLPAPLLDERARLQAQALVAVAAASQQQANAQIERARAALALSHAEGERARTLTGMGSMPRAELERAELDERARQAELTSAEFAAKVATHQLQQANAALGHDAAAKPMAAIVVTSPVDGQVLSLVQTSGGVVQAGAPLLELGDPRALEVVADVLTQDAVLVKPKATSVVSDWGGAPLAAEVRLVEPSGFTSRSALGVAEQRVNVVLDVTSPYPTWARLGDGYRATVHIELERAEDVLAVPQSALFRSNAAWAAYVVRDGKAHLQTLDVETRDKHFAHVSKGLEEGDAVIVHPNSKVADGVQVSPR